MATAVMPDSWPMYWRGHKANLCSRGAEQTSLRMEPFGVTISTLSRRPTTTTYGHFLRLLVSNEFRGRQRARPALASKPGLHTREPLHNLLCNTARLQSHR